MQGYAVEASAPRQPTLTEDIANRLGELNETLEATLLRLDSTFCRLFGPRPENATASGSAKLQPVANSASVEIGDALSAAITRAYALSALTAELQGRL